MGKINIPLTYCKVGDVLAEDVYNQWGQILVTRHTIVNEYIKSKLSEMQIANVWLCQPIELVYDEQKEVNYSKFKNSYKEAVLSVKQLLNNLISEDRVEYDQVKGVSEFVLRSINESSNVIKCLREIKSVDEYTYSHSLNVAFYSMMIGKWLGLPEHMIKELTEAGLLHDIGKLKVPGQILNKKGKLTTIEFELMKNHSEFGFDSLKGICNISHKVQDAVLQHHERFDGSGYPYGLKGESIGLYARIIAIADVFDAMTQNRVYKKRVSPFESFQMFVTIGLSNFDTSILNIFLNNLVTFYVGANILLNNGESGEIVYIPPQDIICPVIKVDRKFIDLSKEKELKVVTVL